MSSIPRGLGVGYIAEHKLVEPSMTRDAGASRVDWHENDPRNEPDREEHSHYHAKEPDEEIRIKTVGRSNEFIIGS